MKDTRQSSIFNLQSSTKEQSHFSLQRGALFFFLFFFPLSAQASFSTEVNKWLDHFFGDKKIERLTEPLPQVREVEVPEAPTEKDLEDFRSKIQEEEDKLSSLETQADASRQKLWETAGERKTLQEQIQVLDQELGIVTAKLPSIEAQQKEWQTKLEKFTRENADLKALIRAKERELQKLLSTNFVHNENFGASADSSLVKWLFTTQTVSQILEKNRLNTNFVQEKKLKLNELNALRKKLESQERHAALLFHTISTLTTDLQDQKASLSDFAQAKAQLLARTEFTEGRTQKEMENYELQQMEATLFLQSLHAAEKQISEKLEQPLVPLPPKDEEIRLSSPLPISLQVTAGFHDTRYKTQFGRQHVGTDFFAPQGTDILAPADGTVKKISENTEFGYQYLILDHGQDFFTVYGHVSDVLVNEGQTVKRGDRIALTGGTPGMKGSGFFTAGPHLHLEVFLKGEHRDPMAMIKEQ